MTAPSTPQTPAPQTEANAALVRRLYEEIINHGDQSALSDVIAPDFIDHIPQPMPGQPATGLKAIQWFIDTARAAVPDLQATIEDLIAEGDKVAIRVTWRGTQRGRLLGADPTGKKVCFTGIDIARIAEGKIVEHWGQVDVLQVVAQLGFMPI